jgi:hypothetical protein
VHATRDGYLARQRRRIFFLLLAERRERILAIPIKNDLFRAGRENRAVEIFAPIKIAILDPRDFAQRKVHFW